MSTTPIHARYMRRALALARRGVGSTSPNPPVGAVIVRGGRIVGEGFHRRAGGPHAEIEALRKAGRRARGATLYVSLEPCAHTGRTPPCCEAVIAAGIRRVVAAVRDPNPITNGRGFARLRRAGVEVVTGVLEDEGRRLIASFAKAARMGLPVVIAKIGQSLDGKIATVSGESRWITSPAARRFVHQWRSRVDAILVGVGTVLRDDPLLTVRGFPQRSGRPIKVIVDSRLRTPATARCLSAQSLAPTIIATLRVPRRAPQGTTAGVGAAQAVRAGAARSAGLDAKRESLTRRGAEILALPPRRGRVPLRRLCQALVKRGIHTVLIEGGGELLAGAFAERIVDHVIFVTAPMLIGGRTAPGSVGGAGVNRLERAVQLEETVYRPLGPDLCIEARPVYPEGAARGTRRPKRVSAALQVA